MTALLAPSWALTLALALAAVAAARRARRAGTLAARASHELRGPLTAAQLALDGLTLRGEVDAQRTLALELQLRRARLALDDLVQAPSGRVAPDRPRAVPLAGLAAELALAWRPVAAAVGRELRVGSEPCPVGAVLADPTRLAQAAGNLVANALEHGDGAVRLRVCETAGRARIEVADDGAGLPLPLDELVASARGPRGLGLGISAGIAERCGGTLSAHGAALTLELPLATAVAGEGA